MEAKHTPGPWEVVATSTCSGAWLVIRPNGDEDTELFRSETFAISREQLNTLTIEECPAAFIDLSHADEIRATAALASASPDLLEALRGMLEAYDDGVGQEWEKPYLQAARAAVAKAEGRE